MKTILFLTGTRADFGKLKPLMRTVEDHPGFECQVFITGMHTLRLYGYTANEVFKSNFKNCFIYMNQHLGDHMEMILANTIKGLSRYVHERKPDVLVIHGDRVESLAGAIVGALTNVLVCHIEGGERSGTIDESIRHSVSKLSHIHLTANEEAAARLIQMGESEESIFNIGSPDIDVMTSPRLPTLEQAKARYEIEFDQYSVVMFHPVTTDPEHMDLYPRELVDALLQSNKNFIVIYPNNDDGGAQILKEYQRLESKPSFKIFPSLRFEYFLTLLKSANCLIGNSSAGIREAPFYGLPSVDIGDRQANRRKAKSIIHTECDSKKILLAIERAVNSERHGADHYFGDGKSADRFLALIEEDGFFQTATQKVFFDRNGDADGESEERE